MKKIIASMLLAGLFGSATAQAQHAQAQAPAQSSPTPLRLGNFTVGELTFLGVFTTASVAAIINANRGDRGEDDTIDPPPAQCEGDDEFNADLGACVGTTNTVTVTGTGTMTSTVTVPVTFTYAPAQ